MLADHGHLEGDQARDALERARASARDLPAADRLGRLLHDVAARAPQIDLDSIADADWVEVSWRSAMCSRA